MKTVFKLNDRVFWNRFGWGTIISIDLEEEDYPIEVRFDHFDGYDYAFTFEGKYLTCDLEPSLSFTEYNLVTGGFSQVRPLPKLEVDTLVYVRFSKNDSSSWVMRYFSHFEEDGSITCFSNQRKSVDFNGQLATFKLYSLTNPLEQ